MQQSPGAAGKGKGCHAENTSEENTLAAREDGMDYARATVNSQQRGNEENEAVRDVVGGAFGVGVCMPGELRSCSCVTDDAPPVSGVCPPQRNNTRL